MSPFAPLLLFISLVWPQCRILASAATVTYDFDITWVWANPDAAFARPVVGVNGQWPPPTIEADLGDTVIINVHNLLWNQSTALHFHGLHMNGTTHMDGPAQVSQCPISPGSSFTYKFKVDQVGTYWYHSHIRGQYVDGLRGPFIVHDPANPFQADFDEEIVLTLSDWYHTEMANLLPKYKNPGGMMSIEPVPDSNLLNDTTDLAWRIEPGKTYLVRTINVGAFAGQHFWVEGHTMKIVERDGTYTQPIEAEMIYLASGQRCSFLLTTKSDASQNYPFVASVDKSLFMMTSRVTMDAIGWLIYDPARPQPIPAAVSSYRPIDDLSLVPYDEMTLLRNVDRRIKLNLNMKHGNRGSHYMFNDITYESPKVPTLLTALTSGDLASNANTYERSSNSFVLGHNEVVEIVVYNKHMTNHPFHLHGHNFQVVWRSAPGGGDFPAGVLGEDDFNQRPTRLDVVVVPNGGSAVLRFRADNPGVWLFHCHMEWHAETGLVATMVEAPLELQRQLLPFEQIQTCSGVSEESSATTVDQDSEKSKMREKTTSGLKLTTSLWVLVGVLVVLTVMTFSIWLNRRGWRLDQAKYTRLEVSPEIHQFDALIDERQRVHGVD